MIILPSRNGMLLRNSNGILASDCGGPVEPEPFSCPCTLLNGDNSDCYDTDCTPSTYIVTTTEESYCLVYVSGSTWQKTVGTRVITLNLEAASETASITIIDDSVTVFSGTDTGTSCIHRWSGSMSNTITPDTIGSVSYYTECEQPEFECPCTFLTGDNCGAFDTDRTPSTYIADFGSSGIYCLSYSEGCEWVGGYGSLEITLNLSSGTGQSSLIVKDDGVTVFSGTYSGTSGIHRWTGSMSNTISGSDWGGGSYYAECEQNNLYPNCTIGCSFTSGCSCFPTGDTPTSYYVVFAGITFCLEYDTSCTWETAYGDLTVTLTIGTTSTLVITDGDTEVFRGSVENQGCVLGGDVENEHENDWGEASFYPACSDYSCIDGRMLKFEILGMKGLVIAASSASSENYVDIDEDMVYYGYTNGSSTCSIYVAAGKFLTTRSIQKYNCIVNNVSEAYAYFDFSINASTGVFNFRVSMDNGWYLFRVVNGVFDWNSKSPGESQEYDNVEVTSTAQTSPYTPVCRDWDYINITSGSNTVTFPGKLRLTIY